jgi:hypothetical protein
MSLAPRRIPPAAPPSGPSPLVRPGHVEYVLVDKTLTWLDALAACAARHPGALDESHSRDTGHALRLTKKSTCAARPVCAAEWSLATVKDEREWQALVGAMRAAGSMSAVGSFDGAWVGLSSPDPVRGRARSR